MKKLILLFSTVFTLLSFQEAKSQWIHVLKTNPWEIDRPSSPDSYVLYRNSDKETFDDWFTRLTTIGDSVNYLPEEYESLLKEDKEELRKAYDRVNAQGTLYKEFYEPNFALEQPEELILYKNYYNEIKIEGNWLNKEIVKYRIEASNAEVDVMVYENSVTLSVNPKGDYCFIKLIGEDILHNEWNLANWDIDVKPLPSPKLTLSIRNKRTDETYSFSSDEDLIFQFPILNRKKSNPYIKVKDGITVKSEIGRWEIINWQIVDFFKPKDDIDKNEIHLDEVPIPKPLVDEPYYLVVDVIEKNSKIKRRIIQEIVFYY